MDAWIGVARTLIGTAFGVILTTIRNKWDRREIEKARQKSAPNLVRLETLHNLATLRSRLS